ncbi:MAG: zinc ribbon domain-containing protein [Actinobacteria bacterium]|jgi:putative FmdB family regulatory protein|nr:zinc ribbon domain-containing protein [Actinomycetota bacterium]
MPNYTYRCDACAEEFEVTQAITDKALENCPKCQAKVVKVFGKLGVSFKGPGFYRTDSATPPKTD